MVQRFLFMGVTAFLWTSCKTSSPRASRVESKIESEQSISEPTQLVEVVPPVNSVEIKENEILEPKSDVASVEVVAPPNTAARGSVTADSLCAELKSKDFPSDFVAKQIYWLCDRGGLAVLKNKAFDGTSQPQIVEYFEERDKMMYYATSFLVPGEFVKIEHSGQLFCNDFSSLRTSLGGLGFESIKSLQVLRKDQETCEYFQEAVPSWGMKPDLKSLARFGVSKTQKLYWRVDAMIAPLNYSTVKQYSSLFLAWEVDSKIQGMYLTRSQNQVPGAFLGPARDLMKSSMTGLIQGYSQFLR